MPNLQTHRFWLEKEKRFITLRLSAKGMRTVDKYGIEYILNKLKLKKRASEANS